MTPESFRKHPSMPGMLRMTRSCLDGIPGPVRTRGASLSDRLISGPAVFILKTPSLLRHDVRARSGADPVPERSPRTLFGVKKPPSDTRMRFAADQLNLTLAAPAVNRCGHGGKCAHDAAEWLPPMNRCWFAARVVAVKRKYHLSVDRREADALERVLSGCTSVDMVIAT